MRFFNPQQGGAVLAFLALAVAAALVAHEQQRDEQGGEDGEGVEEDEVKEGLVGAHHRLDGGHCGETSHVLMTSRGGGIGYSVGVSGTHLVASR